MYCDQVQEQTGIRIALEVCVWTQYYRSTCRKDEMPVILL